MKTHNYTVNYMSKRGYFGIGIIDPKTTENVGTLWRSAEILGAAFMFTIGSRVKNQSSDTMKAYRRIPYYRHDTFEAFYEAMPYDCRLIGVELDDRSVPLEGYEHPQRCIYLLGAEDNGIAPGVREKCHSIIQLPRGNYNVAMAGTVAMYDRHLKQWMGK